MHISDKQKEKYACHDGFILPEFTKYDWNKRNEEKGRKALHPRTEKRKE